MCDASFDAVELQQRSIRRRAIEAVICRTSTRSDNTVNRSSVRLLRSRIVRDASVAAVAAATWALIPSASAQQVIADGTAVAASGPVVTSANADPGIALRALNGGQISTSAPVTANTSGSGARGAVAESGGTITLTSSAVTTSGIISTGVQAETGGTVNLGGTASARTAIRTLNANTRGVVTTSGVINVAFTDVFASNHALVAEGTGQVHLGDGAPTVTASGTNLVGLAVNSGGRIDSTGPLIVNMLPGAGGASAGRTAVYVHDGGLIALAPGAVLNITGGVGGAGMTVDNSTVAAPIDRLTINLNSSATSGSTGVVALNGGQASFSNLTIGGTSAGSGIHARNAASQVSVTGASRLDISASSPAFYILNSTSFLPVGGIIATGFTTVGVTPPTALYASDNAAILSTGTTANVSSPFGVGAYALRAGTVTVTNNQITTSGQLSRGAAALYGTVNGSGNTIATSGGNAALHVESMTAGAADGTQGLIDLSDSTIRATGSAVLGSATFNTVGFASTNINNSPNRLRLTNSTLTSELGTAMDIQGLTDAALTGATVSGQLLIETFPALTLSTSPTVFNLTATDASALTGDSFSYSGSTANITLGGGSTLTGGYTTEDGAITNVSLLGDSVWNMTRSSNVTSALNGRSLIVFTPLVAGADAALLASYKTLTTVNYAGAGGTLALNTYLGTDGSPSDRLIIDGGTATGNSLLRISNTAGGGDLTLDNGILVVDAINGASTAPGAFALQGFVIAGPYEYLLHQGSVDASAPESWFLRSTIDCSVEGAPSPPCPTPTPPPDPPPTPTPPLMEAAIYYKFGDWSAQANVRNIFNERYFPTASLTRTTPGEPRTFMVSLSRRF